MRNSHLSRARSKVPVVQASVTEILKFIKRLVSKKLGWGLVHRRIHSDERASI